MVQLVLTPSLSVIWKIVQNGDCCWCIPIDPSEFYGRPTQCDASVQASELAANDLINPLSNQFVCRDLGCPAGVVSVKGVDVCQKHKISVQYEREVAKEWYDAYMELANREYGFLCGILREQCWLLKQEWRETREYREFARRRLTEANAFFDTMRLPPGTCWQSEVSGVPNSVNKEERWDSNGVRNQDPDGQIGATHQGVSGANGSSVKVRSPTYICDSTCEFEGCASGRKLNCCREICEREQWVECSFDGAEFQESEVEKTSM